MCGLFIKSKKALINKLQQMVGKSTQVHQPEQVSSQY
jgi:hypothetical protein